MALNLDQRQRAILQEMGITVWLPDPEAALAAPVAAVAEQPAPASRAAQPVFVGRAAASSASAGPAAYTPTRPGAAPLSAATAAMAPASTEHAHTAQGWRLHPAQLVYTPDAATALPADDGWLILLEHPAAHGLPSQTTAAPGSAVTALEGDAARLLDNMLRALRLQHHPRVWSASLERDSAQAIPAQDSRALADGLPAMVQALRPARILVLGLAAARAVLGRSDALGRLRAEPHQVAGLPTVVTYDPSYLLRAPHAKPAAWADLCHAQKMAPTLAH